MVFDSSLTLFYIHPQEVMFHRLLIYYIIMHTLLSNFTMPPLIKDIWWWCYQQCLVNHDDPWLLCLCLNVLAMLAAYWAWHRSWHYIIHLSDIPVTLWPYIHVLINLMHIFLYVSVSNFSIVYISKLACKYNCYGPKQNDQRKN